VVLGDGEELTGRALEVAEHDVTLGLPEGRRVVSWAEVSSARVQVEFARAAAGGGARGDGIDEEKPKEA
jgi:hypothetical protein